MDHRNPGGVAVLDDHAISLLIKMFELLDRWDRQTSKSEPL